MSEPINQDPLYSIIRDEGDYGRWVPRANSAVKLPYGNVNLGRKRKGSLKRFFNMFFIVLFSFLVALGPSNAYTKSVDEICEEKGIIPCRASIVIVKAKRKLFFYLEGKYVKAYPVVFGKNPHEQKLFEGDYCTPEGVFRVVSKCIHEKWSRFILLNYPTWDDVKRHEEACAEGLIPLNGDKCVGVGGDIGIHGTHSEALNRSRVDWTDGCISLFNPDIEEFFPYVERGDLVFIFP